MGKFKESDYYKSKEHIENVKKVSVLGNKKIQELKEQRIKNYNLSPKVCNYCESSLSYEDRHKSYCNSSCAAKYNNSKRILSKETKEQIKTSLLEYYDANPSKKKKVIDEIRTCEICSSDFQVKRIPSGGMSKTKTCSKECASIQKSTIKYGTKPRKKKKKKVIDEIRTCEMCSSDFQVKRVPSGNISNSKTCSKECLTVLKSNISKNSMKKL